MKVAVIHPLKHHAYNSMSGIISSGAEVIGLFGYYNKGDIIDKILLKTKYKELVQGYKYSKISTKVKTNMFIKILFLINKLLHNKFNNIYLYLFQLWGITKIKNVDCIHVLQDYCNIIIRYAKKHNKSIIYEQIIAYDIQQFITEKSKIENNIKLFKEKENIINAKYIIAPSIFVEKSITNHINEKKIQDKIYIIPYGVDTDVFKYKSRNFDGKRTLKILTVASVSERKGIQYLIEAMKEFEDKENVCLTYIGAENIKERELFNKLKSCKSINYIGTIPHTKIQEYFNENDIYLLPSLAEGSSLSVYEALASGMPCIVTENVGSVITNNVDGIIINTKDSEGIKNAIDTFIKNPEKLEEMSNNVKVTLSKYTWDEYENKIKQFYLNNVLKE